MPSDPRPLSADELLEHVGFLRNLATELVGAGDAPDVVQEAWTRALERPPRERSALRGWLAVVVSNLARNRRRSEARRVRREEDAARPEALEPEPLALEALELQRLIGELVVALPAEQRTVVYLRYFEGLTPSAIAERLGEPVKTIKTRHTRALAALRARLDARSDGKREAWVALLTPWIRVPAATGAGIGIAAIAAAVVATLGLSWFLWPTHRAPVAAPVETARAEEPLRRPPTAEVARREASEPRAQEPAAVRAPATVALSGVVTLHEDGSPVAGAWVEIVGLGLTGGADAQTSTDEQGAYRFDWPALVTVQRITVGATADTAGTSVTLDLRVEPGSGARRDLEVTRGATLEGTVVDVAGHPVPRAEVRALCRADFDPVRRPDRVVLAGADGCFRVEHLGEEFTLVAAAPEQACAYGLRGHLGAGDEARDLELVLSDAGLIRGRVIDANGRPVSGAELGIRAHLGSSSADGTPVTGVRRFQPVDCRATSDAEGRFVLGPLPAQAWSVRITHPEFLLADRALSTNLDNDVELDAGNTVAGRVLDALGLPLANAEVRLRPRSGETRSARSDAEGRFELRAVATSDDGTLTVLADGHAVFARQPVRTGADGERFLEVRLEPESRLGGRVVDETGRPLASARVTIEGERELRFATKVPNRTTLEWATGIDETHTDGDGRFRFTRLYPGRFEVKVHPADAPELWLAETLAAGREDIELVVERARLEHVVFQGTVRDGRSGAPVPRFTLNVWRATGEGMAFGRTSQVEDATGSFRSAGHEPGRYYLSVQAPGYARWQSDTADHLDGEFTVPVTLFPTRTIQLVVRDELGRSADVEFHALDGRQLSIEWSEQATTTSISVGAEPQAIAGLPCAPVRMTAKVWGAELLTQELDLTNPPAGPIEIVLPTSDAVACELGVLVTDEPGLAGRIALDENTLRAYGQGRLRAPEEPVELLFLGEDDEVLLEGKLTPAEDGHFHVRTWHGGAALASDSEGPSVHARVPRRARRIIARAEGCAEQSLALDLAQDPGAFGLVLLRSPR